MEAQRRLEFMTLTLAVSAGQRQCPAGEKHQSSGRVAFLEEVSYGSRDAGSTGMVSEKSRAFGTLHAVLQG